MSTPIESWPRPYLQHGGGDAFLLFWVIGQFTGLEQPMSRSRYRSGGLPAGVELYRAQGQEAVQRLAELLDSAVGQYLEEESSVLVHAVRRSEEYLVLRGTVPAPETLDYLRDVVGSLAWLLDRGGVAILDWQMLRWWVPDDWRRDVLEPFRPAPLQHVTILVSEEEAGTRWLHTRGMRTFGRPDISVRGVSSELAEPVVELIHRFIDLQALGGVIVEGQPIVRAGMPEGASCHHAGSLDDPDFNNVHVEIHWPGR